MLLAVAAAAAALLAAGAAGQERPAAKAAPAMAVKLAVAKPFDALDGDIACPNRPQTIFLSVANEGAADFRITRITLQAPDDLELCGGTQTGPSREGRPATSLERSDPVPAGRRVVLPLDIGTRDRLRAGTFPLVLQVAAEPDGGERSDELIVADSVQLQIPGLSDVLKQLGVPTLLLLPGFLFVVALATLRTQWNWDNASKPSSPHFWILAVPISLALSFLYGLLAGGIGGTEDLSERFDLFDVAVVCVFSLVFGGMIGLTLKARNAWLARAAAKAERQHKAELTVTGNENPLEALRKVRSLGVAWPLQWHQVPGRGKGFLVGKDAEGERWLLPQAKVAAARPADLPKDQWDSLRASFRTLLDGGPSLEDLITALEGPYKALAPLEWHEASAPVRLAKDDVPGSKSARSFVYLD